MQTYNEEEYLQLSGLQHFSFCRRQWALIHIEEEWKENLLTVEGDLFHEKAHQEGLTEKRGDLLIVRGLRVFSPTLGVSGCCDVVEFRPDPTGISLTGRQGLWLPSPVEYKRGSSKVSDADRLQLCCQAMCLEEMLCCSIPAGFLFYGETRRRERVVLDQELRKTVCSLLDEMHAYFRRGYTPKVKPGKHCRACSLNELCVPCLCRNVSAQKYMADRISEELS